MADITVSITGRSQTDFIKKNVPDIDQQRTAKVVQEIRQADAIHEDG